MPVCGKSAVLSTGEEPKLLADLYLSKLLAADFPPLGRAVGRQRIHGTTKRQVTAMFAEDRPALLLLPVEPFRYYQYGERTVHLDACHLDACVGSRSRLL